MATRRNGMQNAVEGVQTLITPHEAAILAAHQRGELVDMSESDRQTAPDDDEAETATDRIAKMLGDSGADTKAVVKVYRVRPGEPNSFCDEYPVSRFETGGLTMLRRLWGAGEYKIMLYGVRPGEVRLTLRARDQIVIEALAEGASLDAAPGQGSDLVSVLRAMQESNQAILTAIMNKPAADPMASMKETFTMMTMMREAMGISGQSQKSSIAEIVDAVRELKGVAGELGPADEKDPSLMSLAAPILAMAQQAMQGRAQAPQQQGGFPVIAAPDSMMGGLPEPVPAFDPTQPVQVNSETTEDDEDMNALAMILLQTHIKMLIKQAKAGGDIEDAADYVLDNLPAELVAMMKDANWWMMFAQIAPTAAAHQTWFTQVRDKALEFHAADELERVADTAGIVTTPTSE